MIISLWGVDSFHIFREFSLGFYALFKSVLCFKFCFEDTDIWKNVL